MTFTPGCLSTPVCACVCAKERAGERASCKTLTRGSLRFFLLEAVGIYLWVCLCVCLCVYVCDWVGFGSLESGMGVADKKIVLWRITNSNT